MILNKIKKITKKQTGFTLVEMLVVAPIVILVIGIFINSIISMTGDILSVRASNNMVYQIQDALDRIDADVKLSGGFLATNNIPITSPQGYNDDDTTFSNASSVNGNALMLNAYATGNNPYNPTKKIMYLSNQPNACSSANINQNAAMTYNIVYFVKNNTLWRRVIMPSNYETVGCYNGSVAVPWQQPSCAPSTTGTICKTQDEKLVDNITSGGFNVNYYPTPISVIANTVAVDSVQTDSNRQTALQSNSTAIVTINTSSTIAGRDITQTGNIKSTTTNSNTSANVSRELISSIGSISGATTAIGNVLIAGSPTPAAATASYQWQNATTAGGTYTDIAGATSNTYTLKVSDFGKYLKVIINGNGLYYGSQTSAASAVVSDTNWMIVGTQIWAKYNLNAGTRINGAVAQSNNSIVEKYCYSDLDANCTTYGGLYKWDEAMQYVTTNGAQGVCPAGSHIPSDNDWKILEVQLGMTQPQADATGWRGTDQGTKLKAGGSSGLNIPLGGLAHSNGTFNYISTDTYIWSSTESGISAWSHGLLSSSTGVYRNIDTKTLGFSIRCVGN